MTDECKPIDPTAFGLFFVALVSLPIALACIFSYAGIDNDISETGYLGISYLGWLLILASFFIVIAALKAYKANSNFGFIVFGLVGLGVCYAGLVGGDLYINLTLGILYLIGLVWSLRAKTLKNLTLIMLTTALIFIFGGLAVNDGSADSVWMLLKGIAALANFVLTVYLAFALADEHLPCY